VARGLRQALEYFRRHAGSVAREHGVGRGRQARDLVYCVARNNQFARHYYWRGLYRDPSRGSWLAQIEHRQLTVLLGVLARRLGLGAEANKFLWERHGRRHGLPVVPTLAAWNGLGQELTAGAAEWPRADVFVKPLADFGGAGAERLAYDAATGEYAGEGGRFGGADLRRWLAERARGRGYLAQPLLRDCREWAAMWGDRELASLRIVTGRMPGGEPRVLGAGLRVPSRFTRAEPERCVLMTSVSTRDGRMGRAFLRNVSEMGYDDHPETGERLAGRVLPGWGELAELALAAHRTMPWLPFAGWDLAWTEVGPMILELNIYWGANVVQLPGSPPLGETEFPEMYRAWWDQAGEASR
jgi:hypothetical protein